MRRGRRAGGAATPRHSGSSDGGGAVDAQLFSDSHHLLPPLPGGRRARSVAISVEKASEVASKPPGSPRYEPYADDQRSER